MNEELLKENGWTIECESPFEIKHEDGSFATMNAAYTIVNLLTHKGFIDNIILIRDAYNAKLINEDVFILKMIELIDKHWE